MPEVHVRYVGLIQRLVGCREETVRIPPGSTLGGLLHDVASRHGTAAEHQLFEQGELSPLTAVLVNGRNARGLGGLAAPLDDVEAPSVEIVVLNAPFAGG